MKMVSFCSVAWVLAATAQTPPAATPDVAVVLDVTGKWYLSGEQAPLRVGRALPASGVVCSDPRCNGTGDVSAASPGDYIIIHYYGHDKPEPAQRPPARIPLPDAAEPVPGFFDRVLRMLQRIMGERSQDYVPTMSRMITVPGQVGLSGREDLFNPAAIRVDALNQPSASWESAASAKNDRFAGVLSSKSKTSGKATPTTMKTTEHYDVFPKKKISAPFLLSDGIIVSENGWADLGPWLKIAPAEMAIAFEWISGGGEPAHRPQVLFSWPDHEGGPYLVNLPPGLYRATFFVVSFGQPVGRDAWVLVVPSASYKPLHMLFEDAHSRVSAWPPEAALAGQRYLRAFLRYLSEPMVN